MDQASDEDEDDYKNYEPDIVIAEPEFIVRVLAVFHRGFNAAYHYGTDLCPEGACIVSCLFRYIHNIPERLTAYEPETHEDTLYYIEHFYNQASRHGIEPSLVAESKLLTKGKNAGKDLGLESNDAKLDLPPSRKFREYSKLLADASNQLRNTQLYPLASWGESAEETALENAFIAQALQPIPSALVNWSRFDESKFFQKVKESKNYAITKEQRYACDIVEGLLEYSLPQFKCP